MAYIFVFVDLLSWHLVNPIPQRVIAGLTCTTKDAGLISCHRVCWLILAPRKVLAGLTYTTDGAELISCHRMSGLILALVRVLM